MKNLFMTYAKQYTELKKSILLVCIFSIAMAFLESAVVIYLRQLYYPGGFQFPLASMDFSVAQVELFRELATLLMLLSLAWIAGKNNTQKFAYFLLSFALWDIFYYVFLKVFINWPSSLLTWDILFLLPSAWVGPVIAPVLLSGIMLVYSLLLLKGNRAAKLVISKKEWIILIASSVVIIVGFTYEYIWEYASVSNTLSFFKFSEQFIPTSFNWLVFGLGIMGIIYAITSYHFRLQKTQHLLQHNQLF
jgi:hypothetical protein